MRYPIFISVIVLFFSSCGDSSNSNLQVFRTSEAGFRTSTEAISSSNVQVYMDLESKSRDPQYRRVEIWKPIATQIHEISSRIGQYINAMRDELKNEAGIYKKGEQELYHEENAKAVSRLMKSKGKELFDRLISYRKEMLSVDSSLTNQFEHSILLFSNDFDYTKKDDKQFINTFFNDIPAVAAMAVLSKIVNDIKTNENNFITYCRDQTQHGFCGYTQYVPLIMQSSNYLKAGDNLEITAGVGAFTYRSLPEIIIDGKDIQFNPEGTAVYKFKTQLKAGKYFMPVKMQYISPDGRKNYFTKDIEYTVVDPIEK